MRDARPSGSDSVTIATRASTHEAFSRARMHGLETDVARLPLRVLRARLRRDNDSLCVLRIGMILLGAAAAIDLRAEGFVAALPMQLLAGCPTITRLAAAALLG